MVSLCRPRGTHYDLTFQRVSEHRSPSKTGAVHRCPSRKVEVNFLVTSARFNYCTRVAGSFLGLLVPVILFLHSGSCCLLSLVRRRSNHVKLDVNSVKAVGVRESPSTVGAVKSRKFVHFSLRKFEVKQLCVRNHSIL
jgi:hypothetical protein